VKRANELGAFIRSRGVSLTQRGKQLVGLCPFHDDHEPSLVVDPKKQLWNCLGACHEGGDVYRFVMKADEVDFREAHRRLGGHEAESKSVGVTDQQWLERAVDHYHARLLETPAAQDHLRSRGITAAEFVTSFRVGYADETLAQKLPAARLPPPTAASCSNRPAISSAPATRARMSATLCSRYVWRRRPDRPCRMRT
jgi:DNA primase